MNELGMMGGQMPPMGGGYDMGGGLPPMDDQMMDPQMAAMVQMLVEQYGFSPEQAIELAMSQQQKDPMGTPAGILGGSPPRLSEQDYMMLAQQFGLDPSGAIGGQDPSYSNQYDIASILGGPYEP